MVEINRRSALTFGIATASTLAISGPAFATAGPTEGREVAPGVRRIDYGKRESMIPAYKTVGLRDVVYQPGQAQPIRPWRTIWFATCWRANWPSKQARE
jgi:hypothetical protein